MKLYSLVKKNCNGLTYIVLDNVVINLLELVYNVLLIYRDDYSFLPRYLEATKYCYKILEEAGFEIANPKFHNTFIEELESRR